MTGEVTIREIAGADYLLLEDFLAYARYVALGIQGH